MLFRSSWVETAPPSAHNLLSASHGDTTPASAVRGDVITAQGASPTWSRLALGGITGSVLTRNATDVLWSAGALSFGGAYTLTIPATGTAVLGTGANTRVALWSGTNTLSSDSGLTYSGGVLSGAYGALGLSYYGSGIYLRAAAAKYAGLLSSGELAKFYWDDNLGRLVGTFPLTVGTSDLTTAKWYLYDDSTTTTRPSTFVVSKQLAIVAGSSSNHFPIQGWLSITGAANYTGNVGAASFQPSHSGSGTVSAMYGVNGFAQNASNGTITNAYGLNYFIQNTGGGTITTAYALRIQALNNSSGTVGTYYGLFIDAPTGAGTLTTAYGAYINGASVILGNRDNVQLIVKANATQTTNLVALQNSSGTVQLAIAGNGRDFILDTTTGSKIGTATSQKLGFWNATPIIQPTTAIAAATFVANTSGIANDTATWDGYTIGQVVKALRNEGLLA